MRTHAHTLTHSHTHTHTHHKEMQTEVVWTCLLFIGPAKTILQGSGKEGRRQRRQKERWEDNIREWTGLEFTKSQRAVQNKEETGRELISGALMTLAVKG